MTNEKFLEVIALYRKMFKEDFFEQRRGTCRGKILTAREQHRDCHEWLDDMEEAIIHGDADKVFRTFRNISGRGPVLE